METLIKIICFSTILVLLNFAGYSQKQTVPNRILSIAGYKSGKIPLTILKQSKQIDIKSPYTFVSAQVYFGDTTGTRCVGTRLLSGNIFDDAILGGMQSLNMSSMVLFSSIKVMNKTGQVLDVEDVIFKVDQN